MALLRILDIKNPLLLFNTKDPKQTYRDLMVKYHPDKHPTKTEWATDICAHISKLYNDFTVSTQEDTVDLLQILKHPGYTEQVYREKIVFTFASMPQVVSNIRQWLKSPWVYANDNMQKEFGRYLPHIEEVHAKAPHVYSVRKDSDTIPLHSAWEYSGKKIEAKTVAWMISRMLNLSCYFYTKNIVYNGFLIKNLYVEPTSHLIMPYGGWWSAHPYGQKPTLMDKEALNCLPKKALSGGTKSNTDLYLIKHTAIKLLGSPMPASKPKDIPSPLVKWLFDPITKDPIETYREWYQVLQDSWGKRVFVPWNVASPHVYNI